MIGTKSLNTPGVQPIPGHQVLASNAGALSKVGGVSVDFTGVTAETAARSLTGGYSTVVGEKVVEAGTILQKNGAGDYVPATDATTLVRGECYVLDRHLTSGGEAKGNVGCVYATGTVFRSRLKVGGAGQPTFAAFVVALPGIVPQNDA